MTDIRKGDLVKATHKGYTDEAITGRVQHVDGHLVSTATRSISRKYFDFEVLDRPEPEISKELLDGARNAYRKGASGFPPVDFPPNDTSYAAGVTAVINFIREYDLNNTKENA